MLTSSKLVSTRPQSATADELNGFPLLAISAIPKIVCETIHALELHDETPSWKIMDNKGRVTVVLHWDQRQGQSGGAGPPNDKFSPSKKGLSAQSSIDKSSPAPQRYPSPQITVINHDDPSNLYHSGILLPPRRPRPPREAAELTLREFFLSFQVRISDVSPKVVDRSIVLLELSIYIRQNVLIMLIHQQ